MSEPVVGKPQMFQGSSQQDLHDPRIAQIQGQASMLEALEQSLDAPWYVKIPMRAFIMGLKEWAKHPDHNSKTPRPVPSNDPQLKAVSDAAQAADDEHPTHDATPENPAELPSAPDPAPVASENSAPSAT